MCSNGILNNNVNELGGADEGPGRQEGGTEREFRAHQRI